MTNKRQHKKPRCIVERLRDDMSRAFHLYKEDISFQHKGTVMVSWYTWYTWQKTFGIFGVNLEVSIGQVDRFPEFLLTVVARSSLPALKQECAVQ